MEKLNDIKKQLQELWNICRSLGDKYKDDDDIRKLSLTCIILRGMIDNIESSKK